MAFGVTTQILPTDSGPPEIHQDGPITQPPEDYRAYDASRVIIFQRANDEVKGLMFIVLWLFTFLRCPNLMCTQYCQLVLYQPIGQFLVGIIIIN